MGWKGVGGRHTHVSADCIWHQWCVFAEVWLGRQKEHCGAQDIWVQRQHLDRTDKIPGVRVSLPPLWNIVPLLLILLTLDMVSVIDFFFWFLFLRGEQDWMEVYVRFDGGTEPHVSYHFDHCLWSTCVIESALLFVVDTVQMTWKPGAQCATVVHVLKELTPVETCSQYPVMLGITYCCAQLYWGKQSRFPTWGGGVGVVVLGESVMVNHWRRHGFILMETFTEDAEPCRYVLECGTCGVIYRSRQHWYGNPGPEGIVMEEVRHIWPEVHLPVLSIQILGFGGWLVVDFSFFLSSIFSSSIFYIFNFCVCIEQKLTSWQDGISF